MTAAIHGRGIGRILPAAISSACPATVTVGYDHHIEAAVRSIMGNFPVSRPAALLSLEGKGTDREMLDSAAAIAGEIENRHKMSPRQIISANRHHFAKQIADRVITVRQKKRGFDLDRLLTKGIPGIPIMAAILIGILLVVFAIGSWLEGIIVAFFTTYLVASAPRPWSATAPAAGVNFGPSRTSGGYWHRISLHFHVLYLHIHSGGLWLPDTGSVPGRPGNAQDRPAWTGNNSAYTRIWLYRAGGDEPPAPRIAP